MQGPLDADRPDSRRRAPDALEDGLERLVSAGRQLVDGVSGARPGSRRRPGAGGAGLPRLGELGRWVEERLDGLLDADDDDWREPWQEQRQPQLSQPRRRRPLDAMSRRATRATDAAPPDDAWPDDEAFTLPRWQRDPRQAERRPDVPRPVDPRRFDQGSPARPLPRSSRRRPD